MASTEVPFVDLFAVNAPVKDRVLEEVGRVIDTGAFSNGPQVAEFEEAYARFTGAPFALASPAASMPYGSLWSLPASTRVIVSSFRRTRSSRRSKR